MANYDLVVNSKFQPFSFERYIQPYQMYGQAYKEMEDAYSTLSEQTEAFRDIVNQSNSPDAYEMYKQYSDALNTAVQDFSQGMTSANRAKLMNMKRDYANSIAPIARASEAMKEANALRDKAGPDAIFEVNRYNSLDDFLGGKVANNKYQSAAALTKKTAAITEAAMKEALQDPEFTKELGSVPYIIATQHTGGSYEDLMEAIANNPVAQNKFAEIKRQVMEDAGYENYDLYGRAAIESAINTGLYAGLDNPVKQLKENPDYISPELRERQRQFNIGLKMQGYDNKGNIDPDSPYWASKGLQYDKKTGTWKSIPKSTDDKSGKVVTPTYNKVRKYNYDGSINIGLPSDEPITGEKVTIEFSGTDYILKIGDTKIASYNSLTKEKSITPPKEIEKDGKKIYWDEDYDNVNTSHLLDGIIDIINNEGSKGLKMYNYFLELDNNDNHNDDGYGTIEPLTRVTTSQSGDDDDLQDLK